MKCFEARHVQRILAWVAAMLAAGHAHAGQRFQLQDHTADCGGNHSQGSRFAVEGTIGQHDAGTTRLQGPRFIVEGGFWPPQVATPTASAIFNDGFED